MGTLRIARYALIGVMLMTFALTARLGWAVHKGLTDVGWWWWVPRIKFSIPILHINFDFTQTTPPPPMPLFLTSFGAFLATIVVIAILMRFELSYAAAHAALVSGRATSLAPPPHQTSLPKPVELKALEAPPKQLTLAERLEKASPASDAREPG